MNVASPGPGSVERRPTGAHAPTALPEHEHGSGGTMPERHHLHRISAATAMFSRGTVSRASRGRRPRRQVRPRAHPAHRRGPPRFLQGLLTNDILALPAGSGCYAGLLTAQGRMIADMRVVELGEAILIDLEAPSGGARCASALDQSVFSEDVAGRGRDAHASPQLGVFGPLAADVVAAALPGRRRGGRLARSRGSARSMQPHVGVDTARRDCRAFAATSSVRSASICWWT